MLEFIPLTVFGLIAVAKNGKAGLQAWFLVALTIAVFLIRVFA